MAGTALIVGASRGLGLGLAGEYRRRGWDVIGTVRGAGGDRLEALGAEVATLDVDDGSGLDALADRIAARTLDLLFVNAGIMIGGDTPAGLVEEEEFARIMRVNAYGPLRVIERLLPRVAANGTVAAMSSGLGSIADASTGYDIYRMSKAALNMGLKSAAGRDRGGRTWLAVSPGWVKTDMGGAGAAITVEQSVRGIADMIEARAGKGGIAFASYQDKDVAW